MTARQICMQDCLYDMICRSVLLPGNDGDMIRRVPRPDPSVIGRDRFHDPDCLLFQADLFRLFFQMSGSGRFSDDGIDAFFFTDDPDDVSGNEFVIDVQDQIGSVFFFNADDETFAV